jgi:uncharacterized membrane protein
MEKEGIYNECEYCGKKFKEKEEAHRHEINCKKKLTRIKGKVKPIIDIWQSIKLGIGFGIGLTISGVITLVILLLLLNKIFGGILSQFF